jgi:hypothetical protein
MKKIYNIFYEVTISHEGESKNETISGNKTSSASSPEEAEEKLLEDWENGLESNFIDAKYLTGDDIFDVSIDILEVNEAK